MSTLDIDLNKLKIMFKQSQLKYKKRTTEQYKPTLCGMDGSSAVLFLVLGPVIFLMARNFQMEKKLRPKTNSF